MPAEGAVLEFNAWQNAQMHPIVIYANFEALLERPMRKKGIIRQSCKKTVLYELIYS